MIGRDKETSIFNQRIVNCAQEIFGDDPALPMAAFGPWIGKQKIKCFHRLGWQQITHGIRIFHAQQTHIPNRRSFSRGAADLTKQPLDSEKISLRHALCQRANKRAVAAAKIDLQRRVASEDFFQIEAIDHRIEFDQPGTPKPFGAVSRFNLAHRHAEEKTKQWPSKQGQKERNEWRAALSKIGTL